MKVGLPEELLHLEWMDALKETIDGFLPGIQWMHRCAEEGLRAVFMEGDACYPFKQMIRTALRLAPRVDALLVPRVAGMDGYFTCPNFRALPDMVRLHTDRSPSILKARISAPIMDVKSEGDVYSLARSVARELAGGVPLRGSPPLPSRKNVPGLATRDISRAVALIGHPYVLRDPRLNNGVPEILRDGGCETVFAQDIPFKELDRLSRGRDFYAKTLYWRAAREILGAYLYFSRVQRPAGIIQLAAFNCGVEALIRVELAALHRQLTNPPPFMIVVCDEHTQRDHVLTRIEAFLDVVYGITADRHLFGH